MINGQLTDFDGEAELRVRYLTPYNLVIAANQSPINNIKFDRKLRQLMNGILREKCSIEELVEEIRVLPKIETRG